MGTGYFYSFPRSAWECLPGRSASCNKKNPVKFINNCCLEDCQSVYYDLQQDRLVATLADKHSRPVNLLSDGQRTILAMTADIAYRAAVLNPHLGERAILETPGIVLIDEIDLHLHPNWQRKIINNLRTSFPLIQFMVTTHSPTIVQSLQPGEVINLNDYNIGEYYDKSVEDILEWEGGNSHTI